MNTPNVSFVVPCYKLAHLLGECVQSILNQSYRDFEVLIMDDCSPDSTPEVAQSFGDSRVRHIRNDPNLGHLQNYNKGIQLSRGRYVWLISADDYLRRPYVLERYVKLMDADPRIGYVFCSGVGVRDGMETGLLDYSVCGDCDWTKEGRVFLRQLIRQNLVLAASGLVRRECYQRIGLFPLSREMGWMGDWYLWCMFSLHYWVGYLAEPMVCYREHDLSMTKLLSRQDIQTMCAGDILLPWMIKQQADALGLADVSNMCLLSVASEYGRQLAGKSYQSKTIFRMSETEFDQSLHENTSSERERTWIRARAYMEVGDRKFAAREVSEARRYYRAAVQHAPCFIKAQVKRLLLALGKPGELIRLKLQRQRRTTGEPGC